MGLFHIFKKPTILHDEVFGTLHFMKFKDSSKNYFEGKGHFDPAGDVIEYLIEGNEEGPSEEQKQFYLQIQNNFIQYVEKIKPLIEDELRNWKEDFIIRDFSKEFKIVCITIPRLDRRPPIWDMSFASIHDLNHHITIDFVGDHPNSILIDG